MIRVHFAIPCLGAFLLLHSASSAAADAATEVKCKPIARAAQAVRSQSNVLSAIKIDTNGKPSTADNIGFTVAVGRQVYSNLLTRVMEPTTMNDELRASTLGAIHLDAAASEPCGAESRVTVAGRKAVRYHLSEPAANGGQDELTIWIDSDTGLVLKIRQSLTEQTSEALAKGAVEAASGKKLPKAGPSQAPARGASVTTVTTAAYLYGTAVPVPTKGAPVDAATQAAVRAILDAP